MHIQYAEGFENQSLGYALLHPCSTERLHPGVCGYFDGQGDWKTIVDIPQIKDGEVAVLGDLKFAPLDTIPPLPPPITMRWEPKCSADVEFTKVDADASAGYVVQLVNYITDSRSGNQKVFDSFKFTKNKDFGAVLIAEDLVKLDYYSEDTPFYRWLKVNYPAIVFSYPKLIESETPLWIITKTYHTPKCSVSCWSGSQRDVSLELRMKFDTEVGEVAVSPESSNVKVKTSGPGWAHYGISELVGSTAVSFMSTTLIRYHIQNQQIMLCLSEGFDLRLAGLS